ncbi:MAG: replicative DNA helicase [Lachnospiraceae bacterium]|nr:replicative DNA helicase [Lachnospiraceae bacterium]MDD6448592.1 replicative DNA helicase [Lachnospiraceae bacterium]MDD6579039.1 replicative DNA helicase [Lachnospiraceae bacterium]
MENQTDNRNENIRLSRMPSSPDAERSVLGSMIMDKEACNTAMGLLVREDFDNQAYGQLFDTIVELTNEGQPIDVITLQDRLLDKGALPEVASPEYITDIVSSVPLSVNIESYCSIVKEKSMLRTMIRKNQEIESECYKAERPAKEILGEWEEIAFQMAQNQTGNETVPIKKIVMTALEKIHIASQMEGNVTGIPTGFTDLDRQLSGLQPADLILIAARPSMGKTALALNIAEYVAFHEKLPVAIFSLEMPKESLVNRLMSLVSHVEAEKIRSGQLQDMDWTELVRSAGIIGDSNLIIDDQPGITVADLQSKCRKYKMQYPDLSLIMIDYLQLMQASKHSDSRQQEISEISRSIKMIARELNVPIIALSQLSRAPEQRPDHRPMLSDLRESGAIEQDADVVMFIYRDDYYNKDTDKKNISEIIIAKQRNGPVGTVELAWLPQYTKFGNLDHSRRHSEGE